MPRKETLTTAATKKVAKPKAERDPSVPLSKNVHLLNEKVRPRQRESSYENVGA